MATYFISFATYFGQKCYIQITYFARKVYMKFRALVITDKVCKFAAKHPTACCGTVDDLFMPK